MNITRVFLNTSMVMGFDGLREIAKKAKSPATADATLIFINKRMTSFKMLTKDQYLVYYRNGGRRIPLDAIRYLPTFFGGSEMEMNEAIRESLASKLGKQL